MSAQERNDKPSQDALQRAFHVHVKTQCASVPDHDMYKYLTLMFNLLNASIFQKLDVQKGGRCFRTIRTMSMYEELASEQMEMLHEDAVAAMGYNWY